jgi:tetratricopeptide (TPR) repeat protein
MRHLNRRLLIVALFALAIVGSGSVLFAQDAPTRVPAETTTAQEATLRAGIELHDQGKFDEAIARYREVLSGSPSNVTALFEMAYSLLAKRDFEQAAAIARQGAEYKSDLLPMFYDVMASALDSKGDPRQAIEIYKKGIALVPDASQLYYNMAVTYRESLGDQAGARGALQQAAAIEPLHPEVQLLLGQVFQSTGYTAPAFLALSKFLVLDPRGSQALNGYGLWRAILKNGVDPIPEAAAGDRAMRDAPRRPAPASKADEGDFSAFEAQLAPAHAAFLRKLNEGRPEIEALVQQVDQLIATLPAQPSGPAARSFANVHYVPFFLALRQHNYVEPFVYWASQRAPVPGVTDWLRANEPRVKAFVDWASQYEWPAR